MRIKSTFVAATCMATLASSAFAGGLSPEVMEAPEVVVIDEPKTSSVSPAIIVVGVIAALLLVASSSDDDDDEPQPIN